MLRGLEENGIQVRECHADIWGGIEDKSQISSWSARLRLLVRWLSSYPGLILRYLQLPDHDVVIIDYMGQLDVIVLWPFAKLRRVPIVWDAFLSLYNTVVEDRCMLSRSSLLARLLIWWERLACRAADRVVLDTEAHGRYFVETFGLSPSKVGRVFVGAETDVFRPDISRQDENTESRVSRSFTALFYGQFIPLHSVETVVRAAKLTEGEEIRWILIGKGQESGRIRALVDELMPANLNWIEWVPYEQLLEWVHGADVCLGVFGNTEKAQRVIPNKVFQILAAGRPLITGDTPAVRELVSPSRTIKLVPVGNPEALATAVRSMVVERRSLPTASGETTPVVVGPEEVGRQLISEIEGTLRELP